MDLTLLMVPKENELERTYYTTPPHPLSRSKKNTSSGSVCRFSQNEKPCIQENTDNSLAIQEKRDAEPILDMSYNIWYHVPAQRKGRLVTIFYEKISYYVNHPLHP